MAAFLIVFLGAGIGGMARHGVNLFAVRVMSVDFPWGTLAVNVVGSFLMGLIAEYFAMRTHLPQQWRLFLTTGVLGGFTTFSAFSLDTALLVEKGRMMTALGYALGSVVLSVGALFAALALVRSSLRI
ncbi:fluoride efflux transporter CrcB [Sphingomonas sp. EC-HK361]|uniref:fluoride efflux transporter CrcB n=1 Tax=Sphingomonas sp. EC-HK361 TaxID=2038397 RepID=UPI00125EED46|nr:fluoride efflux transporter CrcB [Sphingomonas sp. EC-HK361]